MPSNRKYQRIVFVGDPGPMQQQVSTALSSQDDFVLVDVLSSQDRLMRDIHAADPGLIIVDSILDGQPTLDMLDDLSLKFTGSAIVAILPEYDPVMIQQVTLAGARAFLVHPFTQVNLLSTLRRVCELEERRIKPSGGAEKVVEQEVKAIRSMAVFSPRGGSGCSTLAVNLAISLYEQTGAKVLLIDGKFFFGHMDVFLNIRARNTIADLIPHASSLDEGLVREVVVHHTSGIHVLLAPTDIQVAQGLRPDDVYGILIGLQRFYEYVVIDTGSQLSENAVTLMDAADKILMVATPDLACVHDIGRFIQISRSLSYPPDKLLLVINRVGLLGGIRPQDIETSLRMPAFTQIPDDGPNMLRSINRGVPLTIRYGRSPTTRAIRLLAGSLVSAGSKDGAISSTKGRISKSQSDALMASSRLG